MATGVENIEVAIETLINGMTIAGGFNFDWGKSNQMDLARVDKFPAAVILVSGEENDDPEGASHSQAYSNRLTFQITVRNKLTAVDTDPNFRIDTEHNKSLVDLKELFGRNPHLSDTANSILYQGMIRETKLNGDVFIPGNMITTWMVRYSQDRFDPTVNAN